MNQLRIILIYTISILFLLMKLRQPFIYVNQTITGHLFVLSSLILLISQRKLLLRYRYTSLIVIYTILIFFSLVFVQGKSYSTMFSWMTPLVITAVLQQVDRKKLKSLMYLFLSVFVANVCVAFYERLTLTLLMQPDLDDIILMQQMQYGEKSDSSFRSFGLFGHPLNNGNIMAFMSFIIFYAKSIPNTTRLLLAIMGFASLFCFNSRGAILISALLLTPSIFQYVRYESKHKVTVIMGVLIIAVYLISNFSDFGGRLASEDIMDDSAMVRLLSIQEFLSIPFDTLLLGGYEMTYGENGYLMVLAQYGLIVGGFKIFIELFLSYRIISDTYSKITKYIIVASLIIIGSTNNNLAFPLVFPMYVMCVNFILNNNQSLVAR